MKRLAKKLDTMRWCKQILEAALHKTEAVGLRAFHLTNLIRQTAYAGSCRSRDEFISLSSVDSNTWIYEHQRFTFMSSVWILDNVYRTN